MVSGLMPIAAPIDLAAPSPLRRAISSSTRIPLSGMRSVPPERELVGAVFDFSVAFAWASESAYGRFRSEAILSDRCMDTRLR